MAMQGDVFGLVGSTIEGRYRIDSLVGEGGFGVVYRGQHLSLQHPIAVKCLKTPPHFTPRSREEFFAKFREEGQMLSRLRDCPGVVHVYDFGVTATRAGQAAPYLVLEWLEGQTLEAFLAQRRSYGQGLLSLVEAVSLLLPAIDALAFAHRMKIAHRDIKPANLFLASTARGLSVKVLDFGIAKVMQEGDSAQQAVTGTGSGFHAFSPQHGAPEQFFSRRYGASGPWTDVHALGLVLVEILTGRPALVGDDMAELLTCATAPKRPSPRARGLWVPEPIEAVFLRALALSSEHRYPDVEQFYEALRQAMHASGLPVPGPLPSLSPAYGYGPPLAAPLLPTPGDTRPTGGAIGVFRQPDMATAPPATSAAPPLAQAWAPQPAAPLGAQVAPPGGTQAAPPGYSQYVAGPQAPGYTQTPGYTQAGPQAPGYTQAPGHTHVAAPGAPAGQATEVVMADTSARSAQTSAGQASVVRLPPPPRRKGSSAPVAAAAGALLLVGGGLVAGGVWWAGQGGDRPTPAPSASASGPAAQQGELFHTLAEGSSLFGVGALGAGEAPRRWHHRFRREGGRVTGVSKVRPDGVVHEEIAIEYGASGQQTITRKNAFGALVSRTTRDAAGSAETTLRSGEVIDHGCSRVKLTFSPAGDTAERLCLSSTGVAVTDDDGCQLWRYTSDAEHRLTSSACLSVEEGAPRPAETKDGFHLAKFQYDARGYKTHERFYDRTGAPTPRLSDGCFGSQYGYDAAGNQVAATCLDATGAPRAMRGQQIATVRADYDASGCIVRQGFADVTGAPARRGEIAAFLVQPGPRCEQLKVSLQGLSGAPVVDRAQGEAIAVSQREFNEQGDLILSRCFDARMQPSNCEGGPSAQGSLMRWERDAQGRNVSWKGFHADGRPSALIEGSYPHEMRTSYGEDGRRASQTFFNEQGQPATALGQTGRIASRFDAMGGLVNESFFGLNGRPIDSSLGCHELRYLYDPRHRIAAVECRSVIGALQAHKGMINRGITWPTGAARMAVERGETLVNVFSDPAGNVVKRVECKRLEQLCYR